MIDPKKAQFYYWKIDKLTRGRGWGYDYQYHRNRPFNVGAEIFATELEHHRTELLKALDLECTFTGDRFYGWDSCKWLGYVAKAMRKKYTDRAEIMQLFKYWFRVLPYNDGAVKIFGLGLLQYYKYVLSWGQWFTEKQYHRYGEREVFPYGYMEKMLEIQKIKNQEAGQ